MCLKKGIFDITDEKNNYKKGYNFIERSESLIKSIIEKNPNIIGLVEADYNFEKYLYER